MGEPKMPEKLADFCAKWFMAFMAAGLIVLLWTDSWVGIGKAVILFGIAAGFPAWCDHDYRVRPVSGDGR
jgi:hypothetical protein